MLKCENCNGTGFRYKAIDCPSCGGSGLMDTGGTCILCSGYGDYQTDEKARCWECNGKGFRDWVDEIRRPLFEMS